MHQKFHEFSAYSDVLDELLNLMSAYDAIHLRGVNDQFEVTEEVLNATVMHGETTAKDIVQQLHDSVESGCLSWDKLVELTTDDTPSMSGSEGLVVLALNAANA